jgi:hypothetical protein
MNTEKTRAELGSKVLLDAVRQLHEQWKFEVAANRDTERWEDDEEWARIENKFQSVVSLISTTEWVTHQYHCPIDGHRLIEDKLGLLVCPQCKTTFLPTMEDGKGFCSLSWASNA